jgi:TniQ
VFLIRPALLDGESLSSWRKRSALCNGFYWLDTRPGRVFHADPDCLPPQSGMDWLVSQWAANRAALGTASIDSMVGTVAPAIPGKGMTMWVSAFPRRKHWPMGSPGFCPSCLCDDPVPHFRLSWRVAFVTHCPAHLCSLVQVCGICGTSPWATMVRAPTPSKWVWDWPNVCSVCGHRLPQAKTHPSALGEQSARLWQIVTGGKPPSSASQARNVLEYFAGLWVVSQLLTRPSSRAIWRTVPSHLPQPQLPRLRGGISRVERLPPAMRGQVVGAAIWLLEEWPDRFASAVRYGQLYTQDFVPTREYHPTWLSSTLRQIYGLVPDH